MKYYLIGKTPQTLRNWDKSKTLAPHHIKELVGKDQAKSAPIIAI